jgi:hypothetical protein
MASNPVAIAPVCSIASQGAMNDGERVVDDGERHSLMAAANG